jgi:hypothetical protein
MECLSINKYVQYIFIIILLYVIYRVYKSQLKTNENFESKCCPPNYPDLVYDWLNKPKCYNKRNFRTNPIPNCLPPNFLDLPFITPNNPQDYV